MKRHVDREARSTLLQRGVVPLLAVGLLLGAGVAQSADGAGAKAGKGVPGGAAARGKYLVSTSGCHDCHTPWKMGANGPEPDMTRMLSGHPHDFAVQPLPKLEGPWMSAGAATNTAWAGPWGVSFTANLTPDPETGLGKWTLRNFMDTIRTGRHQGRGRPILPPMPIPVYNNFTDQDLGAIYAYLRTIPAIRNAVPEPLPPVGAPVAAPK